MVIIIKNDNFCIGILLFCDNEFLWMLKKYDIESLWLWVWKQRNYVIYTVNITKFSGSLVYIASMISKYEWQRMYKDAARWSVDVNWKRLRRKRPWPNLGQYPSTLPRGSKVNHNKLSGRSVSGSRYEIDRAHTNTGTKKIIIHISNDRSCLYVCALFIECGNVVTSSVLTRWQSSASAYHSLTRVRWWRNGRKRKEKIVRKIIWQMKRTDLKF
jgi:hypothetical protein